MVTIDGAKALSTLPPGGFEEVGLEMTMGSKLASMPRGSCGGTDKAVIVCKCKVDIHSLTSICAPLLVSTAPRNKAKLALPLAAGTLLWLVPPAVTAHCPTGSSLPPLMPLGISLLPRAGSGLSPCSHSLQNKSRDF